MALVTDSDARHGWPQHTEHLIHHCTSFVIHLHFLSNLYYKAALIRSALVGSSSSSITSRLKKSLAAWKLRSERNRVVRGSALLQHCPANLYGRVWIGFNDITLRPSMNVNPSDQDHRRLFSFRGCSPLVCRGRNVLFSLSISLSQLNLLSSTMLIPRGPFLYEKRHL
jgi:hypothetical protein